MSNPIIIRIIVKKGIFIKLPLFFGPIIIDIYLIILLNDIG